MLNRRHWLLGALFGAGGLGLRQVATGLPAAVLLNPRRALTASMMQSFAAAQAAQYLVHSTSLWGDALNCNAPGMYAEPKFRHPTVASMAAAPLRLGASDTTAAAVWRSLPAATLARTCFFHHSTDQIAHSSQPTVQKLGGQVAGGDMLVSVLSRLLAPLLGTVQPQPLTISGTGGGETLTYAGSAQPNLTVQGLRALFLQPAQAAGLMKLQAIRDASLKALSAQLSREGTASQRNFLADYANSQAQVRQISAAVLDQLGSLTDDGVDAQLTCAAILVQLKLSPVVVVHLPFGGDNHGDSNLAVETAEHVASCASLARFFGQLASLELADKVTFSLLNVFGRDNSRADLSGRDHNANHNVALMIGRAIRGSVVGGARLVDNGAVAQNIDPASGAALSDGGIAALATLGAYGKTLARAVGIAAADVDAQIKVGQVVQGALTGA